ncbi:hypothetical protein N431DRAFT_472371 [Stipitochalara longipes BDJ]|nr:hypothetical protein N431DRAFT_472371 [Stipitochalara longipes BDJ]
MPLPTLLAATGSKAKPDAKTLNAHLALTTSSPISSPSSPYTQYSSPLSSSPLPGSYHSQNQYNPPSPSSSPPREFTSPSSPPVPGEGCARLEPHLPALKVLDKVYERSEHAHPHPHPTDNWRMIGAGGVGNPWPVEKRALGDDGGAGMAGGGRCGGGGTGRMGENRKNSGLAPSPDLDEGVEVRARKAMKVLESHIRDRMPFVQLSSKRMQAVMGVRNELAFDLPDIKRSSASVSIPTSSSGLDAGLSLRTASRNPSSTFKFINPLSPHNSPSVDPNTGKGLREWLLSKGKEFGMRKRECRSISFHDFTPDMRNNGWSNKLLGHYTAKSASERVDFYEVDLPTPTGTLQPWLWLLISRPLLSINAKNISTRPPHQNKISHPSSTPQTFHTPSTSLCPPSPLAPDSEYGSTLPPNFQTPVQTSWMVFASPLENVTSYPEAVDAQPPRQMSLSSLPKFRPSSSYQHSGGRKVYKRRDFDFSHNGCPVFEFNTSSSTLFPSTSSQTAIPQFLEVGEIGPFYAGDEFSLCDEKEFDERIKAAEVKVEGEEGVRKVESPFQGQWWKVFYEGVSEDVARWEGIRSAMARGKCRVVVRYTEFEDDRDKMDIDPVGLGLSGFEGGFGGGMGEGKKIKERLVGRQRLTRSETRRRSGLGMSEVCSSGVVMGVGASSFGGVGVKGKGKGGKK